MSSTSTHPLPRQAAPDLELPVAGGEDFKLSDHDPEGFTMLVFNRGLHCPVCKSQLTDLQSRLDDLAERGVEVVSVSGESAERAEQMRTDWEIDKIPLAHGLSEEGMREWGLFVSHGIKDDEPDVFNEPAMFLIRPDGTVYYESILSMPVGRPQVDELLQGIDFWSANDYPARGEA